MDHWCGSDVRNWKIVPLTIDSIRDDFEVCATDETNGRSQRLHSSRLHAGSSANLRIKSKYIIENNVSTSVTMGEKMRTATALLTLILAAGAHSSFAMDWDSQTIPSDYVDKCGTDTTSTNATTSTNVENADWCSLARKLAGWRDAYWRETDSATKEQKLKDLREQYVWAQIAAVNKLFYKFAGDFQGRSALTNNGVLTGTTATGAAAGVHPVGRAIAIVGAIIMGYKNDITGGQPDYALINAMATCRENKVNEIKQSLTKATDQYSIGAADHDLHGVMQCGMLATAIPTVTPPPKSAASGSEPAISLVASATTAAAPANIALVAAVSVSGRTVVKVELLKDATVVETVKTAPYKFDVTNLLAGSYNYSAKVTDNTGAAATSNVVAITAK